MDLPPSDRSQKRALRFLQTHRMKEAARLLRQCDLKVVPTPDGNGELTGWHIRLRCDDKTFHQLKVWDVNLGRWRHSDPMQDMDAALKAVVPGTRSVDAEWVDAKEVTWQIQVRSKPGAEAAKPARRTKRAAKAKPRSDEDSPTPTDAPALKDKPAAPKAPSSEEEARKLFALVKALGEAKGKPPSALTVFQLYCLENLSAEEVRQRCHCGKGTVLARLKKLRKVTGRDPRALRAMSSQFERIADSLSDPRARRLDRPSAMDQPEEDDGQES